jgi:hypothetical protein
MIQQNANGQRQQFARGMPTLAGETLKPIIEKVAVPAIWFALGFLAAKLLGKKS